MLQPKEKIKVQIESRGGYEVEVNTGPYRKIGTALCVVILLEAIILLGIILL